jgi:hypothetical protein
VEERAEREEVAERLEAEMAEVCGILNAATGRLVGLIAQVLETESWQGWGIHSAEQWVAWKCGVSPGRARSLVRTAKRVCELPETHAAHVAGELGEDSVAVISRHAPAAIDAEAAALARTTTVSQLRRVLGKYTFTEPAEEPVAEERREVSFSSTEEGCWRLSAVLPADEGAVWEKALTEMRDELFRSGEAGPGPGASAADVSWADAFMAVVEQSSAAGAVEHPHRDRHLVLLHLPTGADGHLHLGTGLSAGLARYISCDSRVRAVLEAGGKPVSVGRAFRIVPDRTRLVVENRDGGCRVPGCDRRRWVQVHHIRHWEDGGPTDTANLLCLCSHHHRLHHRGGLGIEGNADDPDGMVFTDARGRRLDNRGYPMSPTTPPPPGNWTPPSGEPLRPWSIYFNEPAPAVA